MLIAAAIGLAVGSAIPAGSAVTRSLIGWNAGVWLYLMLIAASMYRSDHGSMRRAALAHAEGAITVSVMVVLASLASFAAIVLELAASKAAGTPAAWPQVTLTLLTVTGSWLLLPTLYTLNYATLYYRVNEGKGLAFPGPDAAFRSRPHYVDFLYFSFTIAVALQTADVAITDKTMRLVVLSQSLLSFVFNTTVLAFMINIASGLF